MSIQVLCPLLCTTRSTGKVEERYTRLTYRVKIPKLVPLIDRHRLEQRIATFFSKILVFLLQNRRN